MSEQYLSPKAVCEKLQCGRSTLTLWMKTKPGFPKPHYLSQRSPRFVATEIDAFMASTPKSAPESKPLH